MRRADRHPRVARVGRVFAFATTSMAALSASALAFAASAPVAVDAAEDIRDIRAPWAIPPWWRWPLAIAAAAVAALAIVLLVRWWQKRRARAQTPLERARESLRLAEAHARAGRSREWADIVSETLRGALAARLGASVLPQTTSELADAAWTQWAYEGPVEATGAPPQTPATEGRLPEAPKIVELLRACDLARFAKASLGTDALVESTVVARDLVERLLAPRTSDAPPSPPRPELVTP
jgi:hypothetical protein